MLIQYILSKQASKISKLGTNTIHDLKSQLSDEYDPLIDQDFLSQMQ